MSCSTLRVGYVPEHFSAPLIFAVRHFQAPILLHPFPAGTGHMVTCLQAQEIDVAVGLTEGWVAALAKASHEGRSAGFQLTGTFVDSPLCWALSTGSKRTDVAQETDPGDWPKGLKGKKMGVSRIGSGSYVMGFVLANTLGWGSDASDTPFDIVPLQTFDKLREAVNSGTADFFMWEYFTSKRYYDNGEIRKIGEIYTPWPSWHIVAREDIVKDQQLQDFNAVLDQGIAYFNEHNDEAIKYISTELDYTEADAREWISTVRFASKVDGVEKSVVNQTLDVLKNSSVVDQATTDADMASRWR